MAGPLTIAAIGFGKSMNASTNEIWLSYARWARISAGVFDTPDIIDFKSFPEEYNFPFPTIASMEMVSFLASLRKVFKMMLGG